MSTSEFNPMDFPLFRPAGAGSPEKSELLTRISINGLVESLGRLTSGGLQPVVDSLKSDDVEAVAEALHDAFEWEGSDKGRNGYGRLYARLFVDLAPATLFEIGLGTKALNLSSDVGAEGRPGASLKAFQRVFPHVSVFGADIDPVSLEEQPFPCFRLDQLDLATFPTRESLPALDIVVDDGLHMPSANINTLTWALTCAPEVQAVVIEDVPDSALPVWDLVATLIAPERSCGIFRGSRANCILVAFPAYIASIATR